MATVTFTKETEPVFCGYTILEQAHAGGVCGEGMLIDEATRRGHKFMTRSQALYWIEQQGFKPLEKNLWRTDKPNRTCSIIKYSSWIKRSAK